MSEDALTLRSYRQAFEMERRLHRVDRFRIPVPYGIPLVLLGYGFVVLFAVVVLARLPVVGALLGVLPWPVRLILLPGLVTRALCRRGADGRPAHEAIAARVAFGVSARHLVGLERAAGIADLDVVAVAGDEHCARYPRGRVVGPATIFLRRAARLEQRGRVVRLHDVGGAPLREPREVEIGRGVRLEIGACGRR